jgi:hypothetical protein
MSKRLLSLVFLVIMGSSFSNGQVVVVFDTTSTNKIKEAILILPGMADSKKNRKLQKDYFQHKGFDLFIPEYRDDETLDQCVENLNDFYKSQDLDKYEKIHVISYIIGSWTLNELINKNGVKNIKSIIYDRSPIQERAPCIVSNNLQLILWLKGIRFIIKDLAETNYPPIENDSIQLGIIIESKATRLMRVYKKKTLLMGPIQWEVSALDQDNDDYFYTRLDHDEMYNRLDVIGNEIFHFLHNGKFSDKAKRKPFDWDPFIPYKKEDL